MLNKTGSHSCWVANILQRFRKGRERDCSNVTSEERLFPAMIRVKEMPFDHLKHELKGK